jgi:hypothetical protein
MNTEPIERPSRLALKWRFLLALTDANFARELARISLDGYLAEMGWTRSVRERAIVARDGSPIPWATYPFIEFMAARLRSDFTVFEYGAGASTLFYAARVSRIISVEHDTTFASSLRSKLSANCELLERPLGPEYINSIAALSIAPSIVSVDGRNRVACVEAARSFLGPESVLILDDSERVDYEPACANMKAHGFKRLDFWGLAPSYAFRRCTTLFYRSENVLGL